MAVLEPLKMERFNGLKILLCVNILLLAVNVFWFGTVIAKRMFGISNRNSILFFLAILVFITFGICRGGQEIFYWYTGACVYTLPMGMTLGCLAFYIQYLWGEHSLKTTILLCVLAFLASGGVLQVTAILCYGMLILWLLYFYMNKNTGGLLSGIPFFASLAGALINAFAPGNFVRHTQWEEEIHIFKAVKNAFELTIDQINSLFTENLFLYVALVTLLFGIVIASKQFMKNRRHHPFLFSIVLYAGLILSLFPHCLGYGMGIMFLRNMYICDMYIFIGVVICVLEFSGWMVVEKRYNINKEELLLAFICIMLVFCRRGEYWKLFDEASGKTFYQLRTGNLQKCSMKWYAVLDEIEKSKEDEVVIWLEEIPETILKTPGLSTDKTDWINDAIAAYYDKSTVVIGIKEE